MTLFLFSFCSLLCFCFGQLGQPIDASLLRASNDNALQPAFQVLYRLDVSTNASLTKTLSECRAPVCRTFDAVRVMPLFAAQALVQQTGLVLSSWAQSRCSDVQSDAVTPCRRFFDGERSLRQQQMSKVFDLYLLEHNRGFMIVSVIAFSVGFALGVLLLSVTLCLWKIPLRSERWYLFITGALFAGCILRISEAAYYLNFVSIADTVYASPLLNRGSMVCFSLALTAFVYSWVDAVHETLLPNTWASRLFIIAASCLLVAFFVYSFVMAIIQASIRVIWDFSLFLLSFYALAIGGLLLVYGIYVLVTVRRQLKVREGPSASIWKNEQTRNATVLVAVLSFLVLLLVVQFIAYSLESFAFFASTDRTFLQKFYLIINTCCGVAVWLCLWTVYAIRFYKRWYESREDNAGSHQKQGLSRGLLTGDDSSSNMAPQDVDLNVDNEAVIAGMYDE
jgi:hypothetical protein